MTLINWAKEIRFMVEYEPNEIWKTIDFRFVEH